MTRRFERRKRAGVQLTPRDCQTLEALFEARYLTNRMVCRLFYTPTTFSWCRQRLRYLFDLGYIRKRRAYPNEPDVYYLGLKGRRYIAALGGYPLDVVDKAAGVGGDGAAAPMVMMNHELTLSTLYVNAVLECREHGYSLRWKNTRLLELERLGVQPDAYICVESRQGSQEAFIEFTGVVPREGELRAKQEAYTALYEASGRDTPILWLTTSRVKLGQLWRVLLDWAYRDYVLLGLLEEARAFICSPIWRWSESSEPVRWVTPAAQVVYAAGGRQEPGHSQPA